MRDMYFISIILPILSLANSQFLFHESKLEESIEKLEQSYGSASSDCLDQLKLLNAIAGNEQLSWARNSKFL